MRILTKIILGITVFAVTWFLGQILGIGFIFFLHYTGTYDGFARFMDHITLPMPKFK